MSIIQNQTITNQQRKALHKWCEQIAEVYMRKGLSWQKILTNSSIELYPTMMSVKQVLVKGIIQAMFHKDSTEKLLKHGEIELLVDVVTKFNSKMDIDYIPWPDKDLEAEEAGKAIERHIEKSKK